MITWMQKHRRYMLITMWVAVITFIGAGAVDWGGASYGNKASSVAVVGERPISIKDLNRQYSQLFRTFNEQFGGKFDEKMAEQFGLQDQALNQLISQALLLNLAQDFDLEVLDTDVVDSIQKMSVFQTNGKFDIELYKKLLKTNNYLIADFEENIKKDLTISKLSALLTPQTVRAEQESFLTAHAIADDITYKVLTSDTIKVSVNDAALKKFWELQSQEYQTDMQLSVEMITVPMLTETFSDEKIQEHYNKVSFRYLDDKGAVLTLDKAKSKVIDELNDKATENAANRLYVAWKKGELPKETQIHTQTFFSQKTPFSQEIMEKILALKVGDQPLKALKYGNAYAVFKLKERVEPRVKSFEEAKTLVTPKYIASEKRLKLQEIAQKAQEKITGLKTGFIRQSEAVTLQNLTEAETKQVLHTIFRSDKAKGMVAVSDEKVVVYEITAQKLLFKEKSVPTDLELNRIISQLKERARFIALMDNLNQKYPTQNFMK